MNLELVEHLRTAHEPLLVRRTGRVLDSDEDRHTEAFRADPAGYALLALVPGARREQRARILLRLLGASWAELDPAARALLARVVRVLVLGLPATDVATVMLALRHRRANHKHVTRAALRLLTEHPQAGQLLRTHRRVAAAILEHALGKATARGLARAAREAGAPGGLLLRTVYTPTPAIVEPAPAAAPLVDLDLDGQRPAVVTATNRGDLAATLVHLHRGGRSAELEAAIGRYADAAAARVASYPGTLALVLDRSTSMRGYGDREWAVYSQAIALRMVLERRCERLDVVPVGGVGDLPGGPTDLATGVLDAAAPRPGTPRPDAIAVVSDGYENVYPGDLARVVASLPRVGITAPVLFCHSAFGHSDDLAGRRPAPGLPQRAFWHEADFASLVLWLLAGTPTARAGQAMRAELTRRLSIVEASIVEGSIVEGGLT
jgi:hypothetical protein